jgi:protein phosphatase
VEQAVSQERAVPAAEAALDAATPVLHLAALRIPEVAELEIRFKERRGLAQLYAVAYSRYCWPVRTVEDLRLAPFHVMATECAVHADKHHEWHLDLISRVCGVQPPLLFVTEHRTVELQDPAQVESVIDWWEELTSRGGEGMVVKPSDFVARDHRGLVQPAIKCRGREYLRIIYGPEYTLPANLERLRSRGLATKRSLALREFALGIEGLERFVKREPLRRVHECVFGVLALESEPVDPRL